MSLMTENTTIVAIASGTAPAAIGVIRISGPQSLAVLQRIIDRPVTKPRLMYHRRILDRSAEVIDDVMVCTFRAPSSFTGEDAAEIYAHGGGVNLSRVMDAVIDAGAVMAEPGEFSLRAFLNGKIDLTHAEAIMGIIHAQNDLQCREAQRQLSGSVSRTVEDLRRMILDLRCLVEASIDFSSEEELAPFPTEALAQQLAVSLDQLSRMRRAHERYRPGGHRVVFLGKPNAGKSSLFNALLGHERAIVTPIAGTTTDTLEASVSFAGRTFMLVDTAGITQTDDPIERIGVQRTEAQCAAADILVWLMAKDAAEALDITPDMETAATQGRLIMVETKADLPDMPNDWPRVRSFCAQHAIVPIPVSTVTRAGLHAFETALAHMAESIETNFAATTLVTSQRHVAQIDIAHAALTRAADALSAALPAECIAADLYEAAQALACITGVIASDDILHEIFSQFCIGK